MVETIPHERCSVSLQRVVVRLLAQIRRRRFIHSTISDINSFLLLMQRVIELPKLLKSEKFCGYAAVRDQLLNNCWHKVYLKKALVGRLLSFFWFMISSFQIFGFGTLAQ
jgi:hypothetical protein